MQIATQFVKANVMSAGELDYVVGLGTLSGHFFCSHTNRGAKDYEIRARQQPKGRRIKL
jgi:hypothetical protein